MFLGHYGLAFGAKKVAPKVSLLTLFVAVEFVDILWPIFLLLDVERVNIKPGFTEVTPFEFVHYPYTHSLVMGVVWGLVCGGIYWLLQKDFRSSLVVGLAVLSHWFLDLVVHIPDLPLTPFGDTKVGMGVWHSLPLTLAIEALIFFGGLWIYIKNTTPVGAKGKWSLATLVTFFTVAELSNMFGPPPSNSISALFWMFVVLQVIVLGLALWVERTRTVR